VGPDPAHRAAMVVAFGSGHGELARRLGHPRPFQP
jgi:hypothetical protein